MTDPNAVQVPDKDPSFKYVIVSVVSIIGIWTISFMATGSITAGLYVTFWTLVVVTVLIVILFLLGYCPGGKHDKPREEP